MNIQTDSKNHTASRREFLQHSGGVLSGAVLGGVLAEWVHAGEEKAGDSANNKVAFLKVAPFTCDVTPPLGQPIYSGYKPLAVIEHPLLAKGVVLDDGRTRYVLCAVDYCELCNGAYELFRDRIAEAAGAEPSHVAVQTVHQHTAPMADTDAIRIMEKMDDPPPHPEARVFEEAAERLAGAVRESLGRFHLCDRIGLGQAKVDRVASIRRLKDENGKAITRWSSCTDPKLRAMPEGPIDPMLKTITFARGDKPIARLHYYATHPQSFYGDPRASYDVPGMARERLEKEEGVPQIYFTGCAGDVTMGKYNDRSKQARTDLAERLFAGMKASVAATRYEPVGEVVWKTYPLKLTLREDSGYTADDNRKRLADTAQLASTRIYRGAIPLAFAARIERPIELSSLALGRLRIVHLPGEPFIEFQKYAQRQLPEAFVAVAGYGDCCCGYICTDVAYEEGGYEPTDALSAPGTEGRVKEAIRELLGQ